MWTVLLIAGCASGPERSPDRTPSPAETAAETASDTASHTAGTADTSRPRGLTLGSFERWSLDDESQPQHHAAVAFSAAGHLGVVWTFGEVYARPASWLRAFAPDGSPLSEPVRLGDERFAAKPDIAGTPDGAFVIGMEVNDVGIGLERVTLPGLGRSSALIGGAEASIGNNSTDVVVRDDGAVIASWYAGEERMGPGAFIVGGLDASGEVLPTDAFATTLHVWPSPPEIALRPDGGAVIGWSDPGRDALDAPFTDVNLAGFGEGRAVECTVTVERLLGQLRTPPRPAVAINGAGQLAVGFNTEPSGDATEARLAFLSLDDELEVLRPATSVGARSDLLSVAFLEDDAVLAVWEGPGERDPAKPSVWMAVFGFPDGAPLVAPQRISDPITNALRPNLAVRDAGDGRVDVAFVWEQLNPEGVRTVWGRRATWAP